MTENTELLALHSHKDPDGTWYLTKVVRLDDGRVVHRVAAAGLTGFVVDFAVGEVSLYRHAPERLPEDIRLGVTTLDPLEE